MRTTLFALGLALSVLSAPLAHAEVLETSSCRDGSKKCISDMQKRWQREQRDFDRAQQKKLDTWRKENPQVVSGEWDATRRAYSDVLRKEAQEFRAAMKEKQKAFYDALKKQIPTSDGRLQGIGQQPPLPGQTACAHHLPGQPEMYRLCLRAERVNFLLKMRQTAEDRTKAEAGE